MGRPSNTEERRGQITAGLIKVMAKHGYDGASITDIATAAKLTPGLVHYHFKNKREILLAALHSVTKQHLARLDQQLAAAGADPIRAVQTFIDFHLGRGADADPEALACWILFSAEALRDPRVRVEYEKALITISARLSDAIQRGFDARVFRLDDARAAASALLALIHGYFVVAATARDLIPPGSAARCATQMAMGLLRPTRHFANAAVRS